ncbi:MAG: hypothetical protein AAF959_15405 [Cyanobacteria bacterium P01_D01_bin.56]
MDNGMEQLGLLSAIVRRCSNYGVSFGLQRLMDKRFWNNLAKAI